MKWHKKSGGKLFFDNNSPKNAKKGQKWPFLAIWQPPMVHPSPQNSRHIFIENALMRCWKLTQWIHRLCRVPIYPNYLATKGSAGGFFEGWFPPKLGDKTLRRWSYSFAFSTFLNWHLPFVASIFGHFQQKTSILAWLSYCTAERHIRF